MTPTESVTLVGYLAARSPAMRIEDGTADSWYDDLAGIRFDDARESIRRLTASKPFVALPEILADVRKLRSDRIATTTIPAPPAELCDRPAEYQAWHRRIITRIADGEFPELVLELTTTRPVAALLAGAFHGTVTRAPARCPNCGSSGPLDTTTNVCQCGSEWSRPDMREAAAS